MSRFSDGRGRICKTGFWLTIPLSFKQILNLYFDMANINCTSNVSCHLSVSVDFEVWSLYGMMRNDPTWTDTLSSLIGDSSVTTFSFVWSEYWLILTKPFSNIRQWAEKYQVRVVHCLLLLSLGRYSLIHFIYCNIENFNGRNISHCF